MCFAVMPVTVDEVLPVAIAVPEQRFSDMRGCPDPAHLFIEILPKVGHVEDAAPIVEACVSQVLTYTFEHGERDLPFVHIHNKPHCERNCQQF